MRRDSNVLVGTVAVLLLAAPCFYQPVNASSAKGHKAASRAVAPTEGVIDQIILDDGSIAYGTSAEFTIVMNPVGDSDIPFHVRVLPINPDGSLGQSIFDQDCVVPAHEGGGHFVISPPSPLPVGMYLIQAIQSQPTAKTLSSILTVVMVDNPIVIKANEVLTPVESATIEPETPPMPPFRWIQIAGGTKLIPQLDPGHAFRLILVTRRAVVETNPADLRVNVSLYATRGIGGPTVGRAIAHNVKIFLNPSQYVHTYDSYHHGMLYTTRSLITSANPLATGTYRLVIKREKNNPTLPASQVAEVVADFSVP